MLRPPAPPPCASSRTRGLALALPLSLALVAAAGCDPEVEEVQCGDGTVLKNGICVVDAEKLTRCGERTVLDQETGACVPVVTCGEGTVLNEETGECDPLSECGPGTRIDLTTGRCVPEATCGPDTELNEETGECETIVTCGPGTTLDGATGRCVGPAPCADGTELDTESGLCVSDLVCGDGQLVLGGRCVTVTQSIAEEADVVEPIVDRNDPDLGGTPEALVLEPEGEKTVFVGTVARPMDLDGDDVLDQDRDLWAFEGAAGDYLRIEVKTLGLAEPVFVVRGPSGYERWSSVGYEPEPARELLLPFTGPYTIEILPGSTVQTGVPAGSATSHYVGVIERRAKPSPTVVAPSSDPLAPTVVEGTLLGLDDNFLSIDAPAGTAVVAMFVGIDDDADTKAATLAFNGANDLLALHTPYEEMPWVGVWVAGSDDAVLTVDWISSQAPTDAFTLHLFTVPLVDLGAPIEPGVIVESAGQDILIGAFGAYRFEAAARQVVSAEFRGTSGVAGPDLQVAGPGGTLRAMDDEVRFLILARPNEDYVVFYSNEAETFSNSDDIGVFLRATTEVPHDFGTLDPATATPAVTSGDLLATAETAIAREYFVVEATEPGLLTMQVDARAGYGVLQVYAENGVLLQQIDRVDRGVPVSFPVDAAGPLLLSLLPRSSNPVLYDWALTVFMEPRPPLLDVEPNNSPETAVQLGALPARSSGRLSYKQTDLYAFAVDVPLAPGQAIRVQYNTIEPFFGSSSDDGQLYVTVYDQDFLPVASIPYEDEEDSTFGLPPGILTANGWAFLNHLEQAGLYYVELNKFLGLTTPVEYILDVSVVDQWVEVEPNDTEPTDLGEVPVEAFGYRHEIDPSPDAFLVTLPAPLGADESLRVSLDNMTTFNEFLLEVRDAEGTLLARAREEAATVSLPALPAGAYTIVVREGEGLVGEYRLTAEIAGRAAPETGAPVDLGALGEEPLTLETDVSMTVGTATVQLPGDDDTFTFTLPEELTDAAVFVEALNVTSSRKLTVEVLDGPPDASPPLLAMDVGTVARVLASPRDASRVVTVTLATAPRIASSLDTPEEREEAQLADHVVLTLRRAQNVEVEPNDAADTATPIGPLPGIARGTIGRQEVDLFAFTLDEPAPAGTLEVTLLNESDITALTLTLRDAAAPATALATTSGFDVLLSNAAELPAGDYLVEVKGATTTAGENDLYELEVRLVP